MAKITMAKIQNITLEEALNSFYYEKEGYITPTTLKGYKAALSYFFKWANIEPQTPIEEITQTLITNKYKEYNSKSGSSIDTINTYGRRLRTFFNFCEEQGWCSVKVKPFTGQSAVQETYTKEELEKLLKKPNLKKCGFPEYRNWVIINLLMNSGARCGTIRSILIKDVDLDNNIIYYRHTKNKSLQIIPICSEFKKILKEYMRIRGGSAEDFLFPTENNEQLSNSGFRTTMVRYNKSRGVERTNLHAFRHTFAKLYLLECGGDAFTLQKLLGHSTLDMTRNYCNLYNADIVKNFNSPLSNFTLSDRILVNSK